MESPVQTLKAGRHVAAPVGGMKLTVHTCSTGVPTVRALRHVLPVVTRTLYSKGSAVCAALDVQ